MLKIKVDMINECDIELIKNRLEKLGLEYDYISDNDKEVHPQCVNGYVIDVEYVGVFQFCMSDRNDKVLFNILHEKGNGLVGFNQSIPYDGLDIITSLDIMIDEYIKWMGDENVTPSGGVLRMIRTNVIDNILN